MSASAPDTVVEIFDTTLRDGSQREGISYSLEDKLRIAAHLDELGVTFIEGGWPGSNPKDAAFFQRAARETWKHALIAAFGSTRRAMTKCEHDASVQALLDAGTPVCAIFGKSSPLQVHEVLRVSLDENLAMIEETVAYLRQRGKRVIYDAEHFFDGYAADARYALATLKAARDGGAETLVLCDTNGGSMPWQVEEVVRAVREAVPGVRIGCHTHDDAGCGVANALAAVRAGATHVQGTINGYGERCGNANLCSIIPSLELKLGLRALPEGKLRQLRETARFVAEVANLAPDDHAPYVGGSAFAHKGGVHVAAMRRTSASYEHIDPSLVGNVSRVVVSELAGRANVLAKAAELGVDVSDEAASVAAVERIKAREAEGFSFEAAEASVALLVLRQASTYRVPFELVDYRVIVSRFADTGSAEATIKLRVGDKVQHTAAEGDGPVRILDGGAGTRAITRVLIDWRAGERRFGTVGASSNILEATWLALADGLEFALSEAHSKGSEEAA
jgi:2-isopropylmalate synthase